MLKMKCSSWAVKRPRPKLGTYNFPSWAVISARVVVNNISARVVCTMHIICILLYYILYGHLIV